MKISKIFNNIGLITAIIGILLTIIIPVIVFISNKYEDDLYKEKIETIELAAKNYALNNAADIEDKVIIIVQDLINSNYLEIDDKVIFDPRNNERIMNCDEIKITKEIDDNNIKISAVVVKVERDSKEFNKGTCLNK